MSQLNISKNEKTIVFEMNPNPRPNFNVKLLEELLSAGNDGSIFNNKKFMVLKSKIKNVFNLGGDLEHFSSCILNNDIDSLKKYGRLSVDCTYLFYNSLNKPLITISLIQGDCFGGGFECALGADFIFAEKHSKFAFPETKFGLFPGMGAYSFLSRKIGSAKTKELIFSGKVYSAQEMKDLGIIDELIETGCGEKFISEWACKNESKVDNYINMMKIEKKMINKITLEELYAIVDVWAESALNLTPRDLKLMKVLADRQLKKK